MSLIATFGGMALLGYSLDNLSLMALTIASGFVVDDAIVMIENIARYVESRRDAACRRLEGRAADRLHRGVADRIADRRVHPAAADGRRGRAAVPRVRHHAVDGRDHLRRAVADADADDVRAVPAPGPAGPSAERAVPLERARVRRDLRRRICAAWTGCCGIAIGTLVCTALTLVATIWLYVVIPKGFLPQQDTGLLVGVTDAAQDISFATMAERQRALAEVIARDPAVRAVDSFVGAGTVNPTLNSGRLYIDIGSPDRRRDLGRDGHAAGCAPRLPACPASRCICSRCRT